MKKLILKISEYKLVFISVVFLVIFSVGCVKKDAKRIKIGAILPLTGDAAQWGIPPMKGAQLAVDEINNIGGINGGKIILQIEDDRCDPKEGVSAFKKLMIDKDIQIVLGAVCSSVTLAIAPTAENKKIVLISPASTNPKISNSGDYIFRIIPSDDLRGKIFAEYLYNKGHRKVGIIYINNDGGKGNRDSFKKRFEELHGQVIIEETYDQGTIDIRSQLAKIKEASPDALVVVSYPSDTYILIKQAKELGLNIPLYFQTEAVEDPNVLREAGNAAEGVIYILPAPAEGETLLEFIHKYEKAYGKKPELFAAEAYDIVWLISKAIKETGETDPVIIKDYFYTVRNYQGASGVITFDKNGDVLKPMAIKIIKTGQPFLLEVVSPRD